MVVDVKEGQLIVLLPQDEEQLLTERGREREELQLCSLTLEMNFTGIKTVLCIHRVTELYDLGEEEPPAGSGHLSKSQDSVR